MLFSWVDRWYGEGEACETALPETERTSAQTDCRADHGNPEVISRECLDFMIPLGEKHLRRIVAEWVTHYNQGRPHLSLGPGIPEPAAVFLPLQGHNRHSLAQECKVVARALLGGPPSRIPLGKDRRVKDILLR